jgi:hypothetical protein
VLLEVASPPPGATLSSRRFAVPATAASRRLGLHRDQRRRFAVPATAASRRLGSHRDQRRRFAVAPTRSAPAVRHARATREWPRFAVPPRRPPPHPAASSPPGALPSCRCRTPIGARRRPFDGFSRTLRLFRPAPHLRCPLVDAFAAPPDCRPHRPPLRCPPSELLSSRLAGAWPRGTGSGGTVFGANRHLRRSATLSARARQLTP